MATFTTGFSGTPRAGGIESGRGPRRLGGFLAPGTVIAVNDTHIVVVGIFGSDRIRVRAKVSGQATTLRARYRLADHVTAAAAGNPADVALAAGVENIMDVASIPGAALLEVHVVNGAVGAATVDYVDVEQHRES